MEQDTKDTLDAMQTKLDAIYISTEKTRKYFQVVLWVTLAMVVLPALGLLIAIPVFMRSYTSSFEGLL